MSTAAMSSSKLMELPHDILLDIFSRLPATSLLQFRCVSKSLRNLVDDPDLAAKHIAVTNDHVDVEVRVLSYSDYHLEFVSCSLLGLKWFGCSSYRMFGLYNPLRGEYLWLPEPDQVDTRNERYGLGFDSVTSTYKVVLFYSDIYGDPYNCNNLKACVHVLGTSSWRRISSVPPSVIGSRSNAYASGNMYWLEWENRIIYFDFGKEEFGWTSPPNLNFPAASNVFLINLSGSLALIDVFARKKIEIWVQHKEKKHWSKDYSMILSCFELVTNPIYSVGTWEHGIYLSSPYVTQESPAHTTVVYYDLRCDDSMRGVSDERVEHRNKWSYVFSYTGSLISLKKYGSLLKNKENDGYYFQSEFPGHHLARPSRRLNAPRIK